MGQVKMKAEGELEQVKIELGFRETETAQQKRIMGTSLEACKVTYMYIAFYSACSFGGARTLWITQNKGLRAEALLGYPSN